MSGGNEAKLSDNLASVAHSLAGGLSGMISLAFLYPLETIKYQQQAAGVKCKKVLDELDVTLDDDENGNGVVKKITPQQSDAEEEIMGAQWSDLLKQKFYRTAYTGLGISLFETGCFHGTHFYFHTLLKKRWTRLNPGSEMSPWVSLMNGSLAALIVQLVTSPLKVLQINSVLYKDKSLINIATTVLRNHGIMGFWTGFNLNTLLIINPSITFLFYERVREALIKRGIQSPLVDFCCGFLGKVIATLITYPVMLVKTRVLAGEKNIFKILKKIYDADGFMGWFDGLGAKMAQTTLTNAFIFMFKEQIIKFTVKLVVLFLALRRKKIGVVEAAKLTATY